MDISDQIIKVLDKLGSQFGIVVDWGQSNIIPYIQSLGVKIVNYELVTSIIWIIIYLIVMIVGIIMIKMSKYEDKIDWETPIVWFGIFIILVSFIVIATQAFDITKCYTFPEQVILEYIRVMNSSNN